MCVALGTHGRATRRGRRSGTNLAIGRRTPKVLSLRDGLPGPECLGSSVQRGPAVACPVWPSAGCGGNDEVGMEALPEGTRLQKIEVIVGPAKLDSVRLAVLDTGVVHGMTVGEILDLSPGDQPERPLSVLAIAPRLRIEVAVDAEWAEAVVQAICRAADTRRGQGEDRIVILPMEDAIRIRTGERGAGVL